MGDGRVSDQALWDWALPFWSVLCVATVVSALGTIVFRRVALRFRIVDRPDAFVKTHASPVAYLGGLGMLAGLVGGLLVGIRCLEGAAVSPEAGGWLWGIMIGAIVACLVGVTDDVTDLTPRIKVLGQVFASLTLISIGIGPDFAQRLAPLNWPVLNALAVPLDFLVVILFVLGATNSVNLLDGLDGLCAGVAAIISFGMLLLALYVATRSDMVTADPVRIILCLALAGTTLGFLPFNRHPARIFMGDAGSLLLGFVMAALMLLFAEGLGRWLPASILIFGLPVLDTAVALTRRWINHRPLFLSDRGHLYDQMMDRGMSLRRAVTACYLLAGLYGLLGLAVSQMSLRRGLVFSFVVVIVSGVFVTKKGFLRMKGHRGALRSGAESH